MKRNSHSWALGQALGPLLWWSVVFGVFALIGLVTGENLGVFWKSHLSAATRAAAFEFGGLKFDPRLLLQTPEALLPAGLGIAWGVWRRRWAVLFPGVFFLTVLIAHTCHRPYWYYYTLHFSIALAWLGAIGIGAVAGAIERLTWDDFQQSAIKALSLLVAGSFLASLVIVETTFKLAHSLEVVSWAPSASEDPVVQQMARYRSQTRWVFTDRVIYAFHAGLLVPPPLAVIPRKRVWSGQIDSAELVDLLQRYRPEQMVLFGSLQVGAEFYAFLDRNYDEKPLSGLGKFYLRRTF